MTLLNFYDRLDAEFQKVIDDNPHDQRLHRDKQNIKSYAFLMWFMQFYGRRPIHNQFITDGDDDTSCDLIFSNKDAFEKTVFYVVQAKWNNRKNALGKFNGETFRATLNDFQLVLSGQKELTRNDNFNRKYEELKKHVENNGDVKFIYLTLCQSNPSVQENIETFERLTNHAVEVIDIERLRRDFIEVNYKKIQPENPLEYDYNPEIEPLVLEIEQLEVEKNYLKVEAPFISYTFLVRPKTIHDLFLKYGFKLFFRNIRNPLIASQYNRQIEQTLKENPSFFMYFNNGITAITNLPPRKINATAKQIDMTGLQVINGAQTVYSIYQAYKNAKNGEKNVMNDNALIRFHLIQGGNRDFELDLARFTNQQNPTESRDFWAYDAVQIRLQNESFKTNYWYEIRRGEFRDTSNDEKVAIVPNDIFAEAYSSFVLKLYPFDRDYLFVSNKKEKKGLYETVFNPKTTFDDMLLAYKMRQFLMPFEEKRPLSHEEQMNLTIHRILLEKLYPTNFNVHLNLLLKENHPYLKRLGAFIEKEKTKIPTDYPKDVYFSSLSFSMTDLEKEV